MRGSSVRRRVWIGLCLLGFAGSTALAQPVGDFAEGIDVSVFQGNINWGAVANDGIDFAFMKATEGVGFTDSRFFGNAAGATANNIYMAPYHFATPNFTDAVAEANWFMSVAGDYMGPGFLPPVLDLESNPNGMSQTQMTDWAFEFSDTIFNAKGVRPLLYTFPSFAQNLLDSRITEMPLWMATLNSSAPSTSPWGPNDWDFWQYTFTGSVAGIAGDVDRDVFNGTSAELDDYVANLFDGDATRSIATFEVDEGVFASDPGFSGSNIGIGAGSTAERTTAEAFEGNAAQQLEIEATSGDWFLRHLANQGAAAGNVTFAADGYVGFWAKTEDADITVRIAIDDADGTAERGFEQMLIADGQWNLYEWNLSDDSQWEGWVQGDGFIDGATLTIDSIQFFGDNAGLFEVYLDSVSFNPLVSLSNIASDFNGDGVVNLLDFDTLAANFGTVGDKPQGDANGDGVVTLLDFDVLAQQFGQGATAPATVPEPAGLAMLGVSGLITLARRRCRG
ncbi:MAG: GH25 family lysozyme [Planctomycetota bacterium]